jgi:hypothetical protein
LNSYNFFPRSDLDVTPPPFPPTPQSQEKNIEFEGETYIFIMAAVFFSLIFKIADNNGKIFRKK